MLDPTELYVLADALSDETLASLDGAVLVQATVEFVVYRAVREVQRSPEGLFHSQLIISTLTIRLQPLLAPGPLVADLLHVDERFA